MTCRHGAAGVNLAAGGCRPRVLPEQWVQQSVQRVWPAAAHAPSTCATLKLGAAGRTWHAATCQPKCCSPKQPHRASGPDSVKNQTRLGQLMEAAIGVPARPVACPGYRRMRHVRPTNNRRVDTTGSRHTAHSPAAYAHTQSISPGLPCSLWLAALTGTAGACPG